MKMKFSRETGGVVFYPHYSRLTRYFVLFFLLDLLLSISFLIAIFLAGSFLFLPSSSPSFLVEIVQLSLLFPSLLLLFLIIQISFFLFYTFYRLFSDKPTLFVTSQGVTIQDLPVIGNIFLPWNEITSLSVVPVRQSFSEAENYLSLDPKDHTQFLSRIHPIRRFFINLSSQVTGTLVYIPPYFLAKPAEEVLLQIQEYFQEELQRYKVQILNIASKN